MTTTTDDGPAFPEVNDWRMGSGMTVRDYFAAKALCGLCGDLQPLRKIPATSEYAGWTEAKLAAFQAYVLADEMLKARIA